MTVPAGLRYTKEHEWAKADGNVATIGITDHAQEALGEVVYLDLPAVGATVTAGDTFGAVESVKAVSDLYSPVTGKVVEVHTALVDEPGIVNTDPYGEGWMIKVEMSDPAEFDGLIDAGAYEEFLKEES
ncbi:glycine cleavage system protein GcvH [bacterium]|nr:glycine cleavage system protein GcvH [bacterium]